MPISLEGFSKEEIREQSRPASHRRGVVALIDEDGQGLNARRVAVHNALTQRGLPIINPDEGRYLIVPVRNVETWMVWAARWEAAGSPASPDGPPGYDPVSEEHDYKRFRSRDGGKLERENLKDAYNTGKIIAKLNPACPPAGTPPALQEILQPLANFLRWCQI